MEFHEISGFTNDQVISMLKEINKLYLIHVDALTEEQSARIDQLDEMLFDAGIHP